MLSTMSTLMVPTIPLTAITVPAAATAQIQVPKFFFTSSSPKPPKPMIFVQNEPENSSNNNSHHHIFVGDLSPEVETQNLKEAFAPFGEITDCKVVKDTITSKSKGYGFVTFMKRSDAECAISSMNGQWIGNRTIRTNWASRKYLRPDGQKVLSFEEVYNQSSPTNCTVYCGGITASVADEAIQKRFAHYGDILEMRIFKDKGYAFFRYSTKESATNAILGINLTELNGVILRCSWGKELTEATPQPAQPAAIASSAHYPYAYGQQLSYWYPQSYQQTATNVALNAATAAQLQGQYIQNFQYGQQYGYQQGYVGRIAMPASPVTGWPAQAQLAPSVVTQSAQLPQSTVTNAHTIIPAYAATAAPTMQQFQITDDEWIGQANMFCNFVNRTD